MSIMSIFPSSNIMLVICHNLGMSGPPHIAKCCGNESLANLANGITRLQMITFCIRFRRRSTYQPQARPNNRPYNIKFHDFGSIPESPHVQTLSALNENAKLLNLLIHNSCSARFGCIRMESYRAGMHVRKKRIKVITQQDILPSPNVEFGVCK